MATSRQILRLAFQALYQLDIHGGDRDRAVAAWVAEADDFSEKERAEALALATSAYDDRASADATLKTLAPTWPAERQPAVDRAILRLGHYELTRARTDKPKVLINNAVELAKEYSTEKSPAFVNGVLDRIMKSVSST
jgi:N utilization substance protein B